MKVEDLCRALEQIAIREKHFLHILPGTEMECVFGMGGVLFGDKRSHDAFQEALFCVTWRSHQLLRATMRFNSHKLTDITSPLQMFTLRYAAFQLFYNRISSVYLDFRIFLFIVICCGASGFSSLVRRMSGNFRPPRSPNIIWPSQSSFHIPLVGMNECVLAVYCLLCFCCLGGGPGIGLITHPGRPSMALCGQKVCVIHSLIPSPDRSWLCKARAAWVT